MKGKERELSSFATAAKIRRQLAGAAEKEGTGKIKTPSWLAAIVLGFPQEVLERTGILAVSDQSEETVTLICSTDKWEILQSAFDWSFKEEKPRYKILASLYKALYTLGQASVTSGTDVKRALKPHFGLIKLGSSHFPPLTGLVEFIEQGGQLTDLDQENLAEVARTIFDTLEHAGAPQVSVFKQKNWLPEGMFISPGS